MIAKAPDSQNPYSNLKVTFARNPSKKLLRKKAKSEPAETAVWVVVMEVVLVVDLIEKGA